MNRRWKAKEVAYLLKNRHNIRYREIAKRLKRSERSVKMKALHIGLASKKPRWLKSEEIRLKYLLGKYDTYTQIGLKMKRSRYSIAAKGKRLGFNKRNRKLKLETYSIFKNRMCP